MYTREVAVINFIDDDSGSAKRILVQVKSGKVKTSDIRDLVGTVQRESAAMGLFISLEEPTHDMQKEAISAGIYASIGWGRDYPKIQIVTVAELLNGIRLEMPPAHGTFKQASSQIIKNGDDQMWLL